MHSGTLPGSSGSLFLTMTLWSITDRLEHILFLTCPEPGFLPKVEWTLCWVTLCKWQTSGIQNIFLSENPKYFSNTIRLLDASVREGWLPNSNFVNRQTAAQSLTDLAWIIYKDGQNYSAKWEVTLSQVSTEPVSPYSWIGGQLSRNHHLNTESWCLSPLSQVKISWHWILSKCDHSMEYSVSDAKLTAKNRRTLAHGKLLWR